MSFRAHVGKISFNEVNCCEIFNTSLLMILNQTESTNAVSVFAGDPIDISLSSSLLVKSSLDQNLNTTHQNLRGRKVIKTKNFRHSKSKSKRTRQRFRNVHLMARRLRKKLKTILESTPIDWYKQMEKVVGRKVNLMLIFTEHHD